jgi:lysophospholipase L1-like esterase
LLTACSSNPSSPSSDTTSSAETEQTTETSTETTEPIETEPITVSLEGKNIVWLGSSVTVGAANNNVSMADYLADDTGCKSYKYAVSGTTLVDNDGGSYISRMKNIRKNQKCDYFICQLSTNDATQNKPLGTVSDSFDIDSFDTSTICGAIEYIIAYAKDRWNCPIAFYTNPPYSSDAYQKMVDALLQIQEKWGIYVLDMWNDPDIASMTRRQLAKYMSDSIHPNQAGYQKWWTPLFREFLETTLVQWQADQTA